MDHRAWITRFAPSPTGLLHLGHAYSALVAFRAARDSRGTFLLRIEDIDGGRCRPEYDAALREDLAWLGLRWPEPVRRQAEHFDDYAQALAKLDALGVLYPCFCTRQQIQKKIDSAGHAPHGPEGLLYPGSCRALDATARKQRQQAGAPYALRLDVSRAIALATDNNARTLHWHDSEAGQQAATPERFGDVVLARKETPTSYHLSVTVDDHLQGVTLVTRGRDLFEATHVHRLLQALLGYDTPTYQHHRLLNGSDGRRYAKRDKSLTLRALREAGNSASDVLAMVRP